MKKLLLMATASMSCLAFVGCNSSNISENNTTEPTTTTIETTDPIATTVERTVEPTTDVEVATPKNSSSGDTTYILNTNTHKFHYPSCSSVEKIKENNKDTYTGNRDYLINSGYSPCKKCNP